MYIYGVCGGAFTAPRPLCGHGKTSSSGDGGEGVNKHDKLHNYCVFDPFTFRGRDVFRLLHTLSLHCLPEEKRFRSTNLHKVVAAFSGIVNEREGGRGSWRIISRKLCKVLTTQVHTLVMTFNNIIFLIISM